MKKITVIAAVVLLICSGAMLSFAAGQQEAGPAAAAETGNIIEDPGKNAFATLAEWEAYIGKKLTLQEAPSLKKMVEDGKLPPLEQRLPKDPMVLLPFSKVKKIGVYQDVMYAEVHGTHDSLCQPIGYEIGWFVNRYPQLLKSWETSADGRVYTWHLREGLKWSDGQPYTTEDILFWYEDVALNTDLTASLPASLRQTSGNPVKLEIIDAYTCRWTYEEPTIYENTPSENLGFYPKHYLKQFHAAYQDKAALDKLVKDAGVNAWNELFTDKADFYGIWYRNPDRPVTSPWSLVQGKPNTTAIMRRNPYYHGLDAEGKQLPYVEEIRKRIEDAATDVTKLKALEGEIDFVQFDGIDLYPTAKEAERREGKIKVSTVTTTLPIGEHNLEFNQTTNDPDLRAIFQKKDFRFGVSYAINREMINKLNYYGMNGIGQVSYAPGHPYYNAELTTTAIEYDVAKANQLLDAAGLAKRDADGWRLLPNGKRFEITITTRVQYNVDKDAEIIVNNLKDVGIKVNLRSVDGWGALQSVRNSGEMHAFYGPAWGTYQDSTNTTNWGALWANQGYWGPKWALWVASNGEQGEKPPEDVLKATELRQLIVTQVKLEDRIRTMKQITDIAARNLFGIGVVNLPPRVVVFNAKLQNVPMEERAWSEQMRPQVWFFEE